MPNLTDSMTRREIVQQVIQSSIEIRQVPRQINEDVLTTLTKEGLVSTGSSDVFELVKQIDDLQPDQAINVPLEHRVTKEESDWIVKGIYGGHYLNIDSSPVVRAALAEAEDFAGMAGLPFSLPPGYDSGAYNRVTDQLCESAGLFPYFLIKHAVGQRRGEPPIGFYWIPNDGRPRVVTWMRAIRGYEFYLDDIDEEVPSAIILLDKEFYGKNMVVKIAKARKDKKVYTFQLSHLPIFRKGDREMYSYWRRFEGTDYESPDKAYRGVAHDKAAPNMVFTTYHEVGAFFKAGARLRKNHELGEGIEIQVNPIPIENKCMRGFVRKLREQAFIGRNGLNMTEMERIIGARLMLEGYDANFFNWSREYH